MEFAITVILISASGVMAPGPLFASNIMYGLRGGAQAGLKMAYGHTVVEFPLVILIGLGALSLDSFPEFRIAITIFGALGLFGFAGIQLRTVLKKNVFSQRESRHGPFLAGVLLSAMNPFFIIWWFTIGFKLISDSLIFWSLWGVVIMFLFHIWMDYAWLSGIALISKKSFTFLNNRNYKIVIIGLSAILIYYGFIFLKDALS